MRRSTGFHLNSNHLRMVNSWASPRTPSSERVGTGSVLLSAVSSTAPIPKCFSDNVMTKWVFLFLIWHGQIVHKIKENSWNMTYQMQAHLLIIKFYRDKIVLFQILYFSPHGPVCLQAQPWATTCSRESLTW